MPKFEISDKSGGRYEIEAADQDAAFTAFAKFSGSPSPAAEAAPSSPVTVNNVARSAATGVPIIGGMLNRANAITNAALAPILNPLFDKKDQLQGATFAEREANSLRDQQKMDKTFADEHPIIDTAAQLAGGVGAALPVMAAAPAAFGLTGTLPQMVARGAASNAAVGGVDAAVRGHDVVRDAAFGGLIGGALPIGGRAIGKGVQAFRDYRNPPALVPANTIEVAGRQVPLTPGQAAQDAALQAEENILSSGARGEVAQRNAEGFIDPQQTEIKLAIDNILATTNPTRNAAVAATPLDGAQAISTELTQQAQARAAALAAREQAAAAGASDVRVGLGGSADSVAPYDAADAVSNTVAARRGAAKDAVAAKYDEIPAVEGVVNPELVGGLSDRIKSGLNSGPDPLWADPQTTAKATQALELLNRTISGATGALENKAGGAAARVAGEAPVVDETVAALRAKFGDDVANAYEKQTSRQGVSVSEGAGLLDPHNVSLPGGGSVAVAPRVVEASSLKTSADAGYDAGLQPRNRTRAASDAQVNDIAKNLNPERLGRSAEADRGAPIIGPDGMVESGNGRVLAIRKALAEGGKPAADYRAWLKSQGVDTAGMKAPVLVRERTTPMSVAERKAFTVEANQSSTLALSAPERALADARSISGDALSMIRNPADLGAVENRDFVRHFMSKLPQSEHGSLMTANGQLSAEGLTRVRNAVLAKAYGDSPILARIAESTSDDIRSISNALTATAPEWASMRAAAASGSIPAELDISKELLDAVQRTAKIRAKGTSLESALAQKDAFGSQSAESESLMRLFYGADGRRAASAEQISNGLRHYAQEALKVDASPGLGLGLEKVGSKEILKLSTEKAGAPAAVAKDVADKAVETATTAATADVTLSTLESARKRLVRMFGDAKKSALAPGGSPADMRAMGRVLAEFDKAVIEILEAPGGFTGDASRARAVVKAARASHAEYRNTFTRQHGGDFVGSAVEKILGRGEGLKASPEDVIKLQYGSVASPGGGNTGAIAMRLKQIMGENSPEWGQYLKGLWSHVTETGEGVAQRAPGEIAGRIDRFLNTTLANNALTPAQRAQWKAQAGRYRALETPTGVASSVDKTIARITGESGDAPMSLPGIVELLSGKTGTSTPEFSYQLMNRLQKDMTPEGFNSVREGYLRHLLEKPEGKIEMQARAMSERIHEFLNGSGKRIADKFLPDAVRAEMKKLGAAYKMMSPLPGTVNNSGSATIGAKILHKSTDNIFKLMGLASNGVGGVLIGAALDKGVKVAASARNGAAANRLFYGPQAKRSGPILQSTALSRLVPGAMPALND